MSSHGPVFQGSQSILACTIHTQPQENVSSYGLYLQDPWTPKLVVVHYSQDPRTS